MNFSTYKEYKKAFSEVNFILNNSEKEIQSKIPEEFKRLIKENIDEEYVVNLNLENGLENCELLAKTKDILSLIYRDYICSKEEKEELKQAWSKLEKRYNTNDVLTKIYGEKIYKEENIQNNNTLIAMSKEKWYKNIVNKILNIFKK